MIVIRRIYYCKLNMAGPATQAFREVARLTREADPHTRAVRVYTDLSGTTNRVVLETERDVFESPRDVSSLIGTANSDGTCRACFWLFRQIRWPGPHASTGPDRG